MRGRKLDQDFISEYIAICAEKGIDNFESILNNAKKEINDIDLKLKQINNLKLLRKKLSDVNIFLENDCKKEKITFFDIKNKNLSCKIIRLFEKEYINNIILSQFLLEEKQEIYFCVKELVLNRVIKFHFKKKDYFILHKDINFNKFKQFIDKNYSLFNDKI